MKSVFMPLCALCLRGTAAFCGEVPGAPLDFAATGITSSSVQLSWQAPAFPGDPPMTGYVLAYGESGSAFKFVDLPAAALAFLADGLESGTSYDFQISAKNETGAGLPAVLSGVVTLTPAPKIIALTADDPDDRDVIYSVCDTVTVRFDQETNMPFGPILEKPDVDALFAFSAPFAEKYQGYWISASEIVLVSAVISGQSPMIGSFFLQVRPAAGLRNAAGDSDVCGGISPLLSGNWGGPGDHYSSWLRVHFSAVELDAPEGYRNVWGLTADDDKDGVPTVFEYACVLNPRVDEGVPCMRVENRQLVYRRRIGGMFAYQPLFSTSLAGAVWSAAFESGSVKIEEFVEEVNAAAVGSPDTALFKLRLSGY